MHTAPRPNPLLAFVLTLAVAVTVFGVGVLALSPMMRTAVAGHACPARQMIVNKCADLNPSTIEEAYVDDAS